MAHDLKKPKQKGRVLPYVTTSITRPSLGFTSSSPSRLISLAKKVAEMSAFNAFKANVPVAWSRNLYITLVRGIPGTRRLHRRTLEALRLTKCNRTVMRWNTPTVRGMIQQVKRLVVVETEEMYNARKQKDAEHRALRPPLIVNHNQAPPFEASS